MAVIVHKVVVISMATVKRTIAPPKHQLVLKTVSVKVETQHVARFVDRSIITTAVVQTLTKKICL